MIYDFFLFVNRQRQVYYGFSPNFLAWAKDNVTGFDEWMADMKRLLDQEGVVYKGQSMGRKQHNVDNVLSLERMMDGSVPLAVIPFHVSNSRRSRRWFAP